MNALLSPSVHAPISEHVNAVLAISTICRSAAFTCATLGLANTLPNRRAQAV